MNTSLEYLALRQYIKILEGQEGGTMAGMMNRAIEEELTPRQRELIKLYYIDQIPMQRIAEMQGVKISTVSRTIKRGRDRLKRFMRYSGRALMDSLKS